MSLQLIQKVVVLEMFLVVVCAVNALSHCVLGGTYFLLDCPTSMGESFDQAYIFASASAILSLLTLLSWLVGVIVRPSH